MVRNKAMGSIHTILLVLVLDFRKQAFDLKSVSIKRIVCSVDCGGWLTDCIQQGARGLYFETGQPAGTGHCEDKWNRSWSFTELTRRLSDTDSVTDSTLSGSIQHDLALTPRDWVSGKSKSLVGYAENHKRNDQRTWQNNRDFLSSLDWSLDTGTWSRTLTTQAFHYSAHYFY